MLLNILCCYSVFNENAISVNKIQDNNTIMAEYTNNEDEDYNKDNYEDSIAINEEQNDGKNSKQKKHKKKDFSTSCQNEIIKLCKTKKAKKNSTKINNAKQNNKNKTKLTARSQSKCKLKLKKYLSSLGADCLAYFQSQHKSNRKLSNVALSTKEYRIGLNNINNINSTNSETYIAEPTFQSSGDATIDYMRENGIKSLNKLSQMHEKEREESIKQHKQYMEKIKPKFDDIDYFQNNGHEYGNVIILANGASVYSSQLKRFEKRYGNYLNNLSMIEKIELMKKYFPNDVNDVKENNIQNEIDELDVDEANDNDE